MTSTNSNHSVNLATLYSSYAPGGSGNGFRSGSTMIRPFFASTLHWNKGRGSSSTAC